MVHIICKFVHSTNEQGDRTKQNDKVFESKKDGREGIQID